MALRSLNRSQRSLVILVVLIGVMAAVYVQAFRSSPSQPEEVQVPVSGNLPESQRPEIGGSGPEGSSQRDAQRERAMRLAWRRDPFTRGAAMGQMNGLQLSGILWDARAPIAIINGQMVRTGEEFEGYRVVEISHDRVSITDGSQTFQLTTSP